jgi:hypothetical protein
VVATDFSAFVVHLTAIEHSALSDLVRSFALTLLVYETSTPPACTTSKISATWRAAQASQLLRAATPASGFVYASHSLTPNISIYHHFYSTLFISINQFKFLIYLSPPNFTSNQ